MAEISGGVDTQTERRAPGTPRTSVLRTKTDHATSGMRRWQLHYYDSHVAHPQQNMRPILSNERSMTADLMSIPVPRLTVSVTLGAVL